MEADKDRERECLNDEFSQYYVQNLEVVTLEQHLQVTLWMPLFFNYI